MSEHTPGPWTYAPRHICEGEPEVRAPEGWLICCTASDEDARLIAAAPDWKARAEAAEADLAVLKSQLATAVGTANQRWARIAELEARLARVPDREAVARAIRQVEGCEGCADDPEIDNACHCDTLALAAIAAMQERTP